MITMIKLWWCWWWQWGMMMMIMLTWNNDDRYRADINLNHCVIRQCVVRLWVCNLKGRILCHTCRHRYKCHQENEQWLQMSNVNRRQKCQILSEWDMEFPRFKDCNLYFVTDKQKGKMSTWILRGTVCVQVTLNKNIDYYAFMMRLGWHDICMGSISNYEFIWCYWYSV